MSDEFLIPPDERYELQKLRVLTEVQDDLTAWAKRKLGVIVLGLALLGFFGAGGFISLTVGDRIEKEMDAVDVRVLEAVRSVVEAELSARNATQIAEAETNRVTKAAQDLRSTVESISVKAENIGEQLKNLSTAIGSTSENVRSEARLLAGVIEKRVSNLEKITSEFANSTGVASPREINTAVQDLKREGEVKKERFSQNSRYGVEITYAKENKVLAVKFETMLREEGYRTSLWTNLPEIEKVWGVPLDYLDGKITILHPPGKKEIGRQLSEVLKSKLSISVIKLGPDKGSVNEFAFGLLIPPGFSKDL